MLMYRLASFDPVEPSRIGQWRPACIVQVHAEDRVDLFVMLAPGDHLNGAAYLQKGSVLEGSDTGHWTWNLPNYG